MSRLVWDNIGERLFEAGVSQGTLYPMKTDGSYDTGVAWNGLTGITESPSGAEPTDLWADNQKYATLRSAEDFGATLEAYTSPEEFSECDGSAEVAPGVYIGQQARRAFGLAYKTQIGSDVDTAMTGYKLHLIYGCTASPSEKGYTTINDSPDAITFSWELTTIPAPVTGHKGTASMVIDSTKVEEAKMKALEDLLFGSETDEPTLPLPDEVIALMATTQP